MITQQLIKIKEQTRKVLDEARIVSKLFDKAYGFAIYEQFKGGEIVTWEQLEKVDIGQLLDLPSSQGGDIKYKRTENEDDTTLKYDAYFDDKSILPRHKHDCVEVVFIKHGSFHVIFGRPEDCDVKEFDVIKGEVINIPANMPHQFENTADGKTIVIIKYLKP